ncbi:MAG TPA: twin-arginine translocase subunit TatC [Dermatophilaceae bacterium]|nr:twin-arginine translocase subunit TatC [Dermatophilaceae bacterium]
MALIRRRTPKDPEGRMALADHLRELRNRLVISLLAIVVGAALGWAKWGEIFDTLVAPFAAVRQSKSGAVVQVNFGTMTDSFSIMITVGLFVGLIVASPVWLWQAWAFVLPGLTKREKRISLGFFAAAVPLFLGGCWMAYLVLPRAVQTLLSFTPDSGSNIIYAPDYLSFVLKFILAFGLGFLMPLFLVGLNGLRILPGRVMLKGWRVAVFLCFLFTAIMTPTPDPWTMIIMAIPMVALFFVAVGISLLVDRRRAKREGSTEWAQLADDEASTI